MRPATFASALAFSAGAALLAFGFSQANADTRTYSMRDFTSVYASASVQVVLKQGPYSISAESSDGKFDELDIRTDGRRLLIGRKGPGHWGPGPRYTVTVSAPDYSGVGVSSSAKIHGEGLVVKQIDVRASSSGRVELSGACQGLTARVSSSSRFDGEGLKCETADVDASSSARADVFASKSADGRASSSAKINVFGKPAQFEEHTSSSGRVTAH